MQRIEAMAAIYPALEQHIVVTNMGAVAVELYSLGHRPNFFYLEHSMGKISNAARLSAALVLVLAAACGPEPTPKVLVIGIDGIRPDVLA